jgi:hypothetical protein
MEQAEHRIAVLDRGIEPVGRQAQIARDRREQFVAGIVERLEQLEKGLAKALGAIGPDIGGICRGEAMALRQLAADMPEFLEVDMARPWRSRS